MNRHQEYLVDKNPEIAYTEMKIKCLITDLETRKDKNEKDYWIIRTLLGETRKSYLAFSNDYALASRAAYLLMNYHGLINKKVLLTIKKRNKDNLEKVVDLEIEK